MSATYDLAFLLSTCPENFVRYMHDHPGSLDGWLVEVHKSLFWGESKDEGKLRSYKAALISSVQHASTKYTSQKKQVLKCLRASRVRLIQ